MATWSSENARQAIRAYWWVAIEGIRKRFGTYQPSWNPADAGTNQYIDTLLAEPPQIGGQLVQPLDGRNQIPNHNFTLHDIDEEITDMVAVSDTPKAKTFLTCEISASDTTIPVDAISEFTTPCHVYIDRETIYAQSTITNGPTVRAADPWTGTATGGTTTDMQDNNAGSPLRLGTVKDYWVGAMVKFTNGLAPPAGNLNEERFVIISTASVADDDLWYENALTSWKVKFPDDEPLPVAVGAGDTYEITPARCRVYDNGIPGAADSFWKGARFVVTADAKYPENVGQVRWVKSFDASEDLLEFYEPLPMPATSALNYTMVVYSLSSCQRGRYGSEAVKHSVLDQRGEPIPIPVVDKPSFIKTRRVWIYENRVGCAENQAKMNHGVIDDYRLMANGQAYTFDCSGLLKLMSQKVMWGSAESRLTRRLWGGFFGDYMPQLEGFSSEAHESVWTKYMKFPWPCFSDGDGLNLSVTEIFYESDDSFKSSGHIKIGNEIIRYISKFTKTKDCFAWEMYRAFKLDDHFDISSLDIGDWTGFNDFLDKLSTHNRGLFSEKIGLEPIKHKAILNSDPDGNNREIDDKFKYIPAFMEEHEIGEDIMQVCVCEDSENSDLPRYDEIHFDNRVGTHSTLPQTVTGGRSGATATVMDSTTDGALYVIEMSGTFQPDEQITIPGGWSADVTEVRLGDGTALPARNNPFIVLLQLMLSTGTQGDNGKYDTLPEGWGLSIDQTLVDITGIETMADRFKSMKIDFVLWEAQPLQEWAEDNIFRFLQVFPFETVDGQISLEVLYTEDECQQRETTDSETFTEIDNDNFTIENLPDWTSGPPPTTKIKIKYNKHPVEDEYYSTLEVNFKRSQTYYRDFGRTVEIECGVLYIPHPVAHKINPMDPQLPNMVTHMINPMWGRHSTHPAPVIKATTRYGDMDVDIGEIVKVTHSEMPNLRTGSRGLSGEYFQVMGSRRGDDKRSVELTLWQVGVHDLVYGRKSPSAIVVQVQVNVPVGKTTVTLQSNAFTALHHDRYDKDFFVANDTVAFYTQAMVPTGGVAAPEVKTIESVTSGSTQTVIFNTIVWANVPNVDDYMEIAPYDNATSTRKSTVVFNADEDRELGAAGGNAFKYK